MQWVFFMIQDLLTFMFTEAQSNPIRFVLILVFFLGFWILRRLGRIESMLVEQMYYLKQLEMNK